MSEEKIKKDEWAIVLDFLPHGRTGMERSQPLAQVLGETYFSLLEVIIRDGVTLRTGDRVYIGDKKREKVKYIRGRIDFKDLTTVSKEEIEDVVKELVEKKKERFLDFFNNSGPISTRLHQIELLPGIGRKHLWVILDNRKEKPFSSFEDLKKRIPLLPEPEKIIVKRILEELEDKDKYRIFVPKFSGK